MSLSMMKRKKAWVITDRFTKTNSNNQPIVLTTKSNFDQNRLHSTGTFARKDKNDELIKTLDFSQNVGSSASLWWDSSEGVYGGSSHSVYTMDNNETSVSDSSRGPELLANTDYKWKLNTCFSPNFNHGTEIVVPMADHFKLDLDQTNKLNENLQDQYGLTFTQDGNDVKVSFPKLTDDQLAKLNKDGNYKTSFDFSICGKFDMDVPQGNAPLKNTIRPTLIEKTNEQDGKNTDGIGATPVVILGQDHALATVPVGNIIQDHVGPDRYEYKADGSLDYDKPVTPIEDKDDHDLNKSINIDNVSPYNLKNVVATIDVPDGMDMSALSVINQDKAFDYTFTFADGTTESGSYTSGSSIPAKANKPIKSIQLKFKDLKAYEKVENFGLNGVLAKKYSDGRDGLPGNVLNTKLNLTFDQANTNRGPADFYGQQKVVAKNPVKPEIHDFRDYLNGQQKSDSTTNLGAKNTGHIYVYNSDMYQDSEKLTYYIVLSTNAVVNSEKGLEDLPADAKVDELQVNGRTVLKISGTYERDTKKSAQSLDS